MAATGKINRFIKAAVEQRLRWIEVCKTAKREDWCACTPLLGPVGINSLMHFAPVDVKVEWPERSAWDAAFFCPTCSRPRTPCFLFGVWPAGMRERLTGEQLEEELEVEAIEEEQGQRVVSPFSNGNGHTNGHIKPAVRRDDDEWGNSDSDDDWAL